MNEENQLINDQSQNTQLINEQTLSHQNDQVTSLGLPPKQQLQSSQNQENASESLIVVNQKSQRDLISSGRFDTSISENLEDENRKQDNYVLSVQIGALKNLNEQNEQKAENQANDFNQRITLQKQDFAQILEQEQVEKQYKQLNQETWNEDAQILSQESVQNVLPKSIMNQNSIVYKDVIQQQQNQQNINQKQSKRRYNQLNHFEVEIKNESNLLKEQYEKYIDQVSQNPYNRDLTLNNDFELIQESITDLDTKRSNDNFIDVVELPLPNLDLKSERSSIHNEGNQNQKIEMEANNPKELITQHDIQMNKSDKKQKLMQTMQELEQRLIAETEQNDELQLKLNQFQNVLKQSTEQSDQQVIKLKQQSKNLNSKNSNFESVIEKLTQQVIVLQEQLELMQKQNEEEVKLKQQLLKQIIAEKKKAIAEIAATKSQKWQKKNQIQSQVQQKQNLNKRVNKQPVQTQRSASQLKKYGGKTSPVPQRPQTAQSILKNQKKIQKSRKLSNSQSTITQEYSNQTPNSQDDQFKKLKQEKLLLQADYKALNERMNEVESENEKMRQTHLKMMKEMKKLKLKLLEGMFKDIAENQKKQTSEMKSFNTDRDYGYEENKEEKYSQVIMLSEQNYVTQSEKKEVKNYQQSKLIIKKNNEDKKNNAESRDFDYGSDMTSVEIRNLLKEIDKSNFKLKDKYETQKQTAKVTETQKRNVLELKQTKGQQQNLSQRVNYHNTMEQTKSRNQSVQALQNQQIKTSIQVSPRVQLHSERKQQDEIQKKSKTQLKKEFLAQQLALHIQLQQQKESRRKKEMHTQYEDVTKNTYQ